MYCNKCGHANPNDASFCSKCGLPVMAMSNAAGDRVVTAPADMMPPPLPPRAAPCREHVGAVDEEAWRAVIGKNADYYLPRFKTMATGGPAPRWHWPAFFVTWYWLLYRRMWWLALAYIFAPYVIGAIAGLAAAALVGSAGASTDVVPIASAIVFALFLVVPPLFANTWYFRHCQKLIAKAKARTSSREGYLGFLTAKGGSGGAVIIILVLVGIAFIGILAAVALPAYQDYTKRAKVAQGVELGRSSASAVVGYYRRTGQVPANLKVLSPAIAKPSSVSEVAIDSENGTVSVEVTGVGVVNIQPRVKGDVVTFECSSPDIRKAWLPTSCR